MCKTLLSFCAVLMLVACASFADDAKNPGAASKEQDRQPGNSQTFLLEAAKGGMMEVRMGELAVKNAQNEDVKRFGQRMVDDHGKANQELMQIAQKKNVRITREMGADHQKMIDHMADLKGEQFDKMYMRHMVEDHVKDVAEFEKVSENAQDQDIKTFASNTLPILQQHLKMAREIAKSIGADVKGELDPATK